MKLLPRLLMLGTMLALTSFYPVSNPIQTINPLLGDISFIQKYGHAPSPDTDEVLRIRTHLEYVGDILRAKDVSALTPELQEKRRNALDLLDEYAANEQYPKNYDYLNERKPCFIDRDGAICAVGFLIERTAGRKVAEKINAQHQYDEILEMRDPEVEQWVASSGLTLEECAMIQPAYNSPTRNYIEPGYAVSSSVITAVNLSLNGLNGVQITRGARSKLVGIMGLATGASQVVYGSVMYPAKEADWFGREYTHESERVLSVVNIGVGASTLILSAWNLISNHKRKDRLMAWKIYSYPAGRNTSGVAVGYTRKF